MKEYVDIYPTSISEPDFHENMIDYTIENLEVQFEEDDNEMRELYETEIEERVENISELFYTTFMPKRSLSKSYIIQNLTKREIENISRKIDYLKNN